MRRQVSAACPLVGRSGQTPRGIPGQDRAGDALQHARPNRWGADRGRSSPACPDQGQALTGQGCCPAQDLSRQDEQQRNGTACMSSVTVPACDRAGRMSRPPDHGPQDELAVPNGPPRAYGTPQTSAGIAMRFGGRSGGSSTGAPPRLDLQTSRVPRCSPPMCPRQGIFFLRISHPNPGESVTRQVAVGRGSAGGTRDSGNNQDHGRAAVSGLSAFCHDLVRFALSPPPCPQDFASVLS